MLDVRLTQDADYLLCVLYDAYRQRCKNGISRYDAKFFGNSESIQEEYIQQWSTDDIDEVARELFRQGMIECQFGDDTVCAIFLLDDGLVYMENRFSDNFDKLTQRLSALRSIIFG